MSSSVSPQQQPNVISSNTTTTPPPPRGIMSADSLPLLVLASTTWKQLRNWGSVICYGVVAGVTSHLFLLPTDLSAFYRDRVVATDLKNLPLLLRHSTRELVFLSYIRNSWFHFWLFTCAFGLQHSYETQYQSQLGSLVHSTTTTGSSRRRKQSQKPPPTTAVDELRQIGLHSQLSFCSGALAGVLANLSCSPLDFRWTRAAYYSHHTSSSSGGSGGGSGSIPWRDALRGRFLLAFLQPTLRAVPSYALHYGAVFGAQRWLSDVVNVYCVQPSCRNSLKWDLVYSSNTWIQCCVHGCTGSVSAMAVKLASTLALGNRGFPFRAPPSATTSRPGYLSRLLQWYCYHSYYHPASAGAIQPALLYPRRWAHGAEVWSIHLFRTAISSFLLFALLSAAATAKPLPPVQKKHNNEP